jgi:formate-dependent nitrite reductase cytochrome c552 subunit
VTGSYSLPIRMKHGYRFTICLNCHGQSSKFIQEKGHAGVVNKVVSGQSVCTDCHTRSHAGQPQGRPS